MDWWITGHVPLTSSLILIPASVNQANYAYFICKYRDTRKTAGTRTHTRACAHSWLLVGRLKSSASLILSKSQSNHWPTIRRYRNAERRPSPARSCSDLKIPARDVQRYSIHPVSRSLLSRRFAFHSCNTSDRRMLFPYRGAKFRSEINGDATGVNNYLRAKRKWKYFLQILLHLVPIYMERGLAETYGSIYFSDLRTRRYW